MLYPKKRKYRRPFRGTMRGVASRGVTLSFGEYGLKALGNCWVTSRQIEAARRAISHHTKRNGKLWIRIFPHKPITAKGAEVPMGGGKGAVDHYVFPITPGRIIFELDGTDEETARDAFRKAGDKLSIKTRFVKK